GDTTIRLPRHYRVVGARRGCAQIRRRAVPTGRLRQLPGVSRRALRQRLPRLPRRTDLAGIPDSRNPLHPVTDPAHRRRLPEPLTTVDPMTTPRIEPGGLREL